MNSESATEITSLGADALAALIRRRRLGAVEALEAYLRRIDAVNPALNAIIHLDAERAMARAQTLDARCRPLGPLHGIPMTLKDAHRVRGMPTRVGDPEAPTTTARTDGAVAARLRAAGAVLIGKTNVSRNLADFGAQNPIHGRTAHPADPSRTPGGSSGGAAAALAAYLTPLEVGSDLAGSIRIPAAFCGIVGLKPSMGLVPVAGHVSDPVRHPRGGGSNVLTSVGPMARTLDDLDLLLRVLTGRSSRTHRRTDEGSLTFIEPFEAAPLQGDVATAFVRCADRARSAGLTVRWMGCPIPPREQHRAWVDLHRAAARHGSAWPSQHPGLLRRRAAIAAAWNQALSACSALVLPAAMTTAFTERPAGTPLDIDGTPVPYWRLSAYTEPFNLVDLPALVIPVDTDGRGLPIGVQLVGRRGGERQLIALAGRLVT